MCLDKRVRRNPKYVPTKANNYSPPDLPDTRLAWLWYDCGRCAECLRKRAMSWRTRLHKEYYGTKDNFHFLTLTFSDESIAQLKADYIDLFPELDRPDDNDIARFAVRRFLERYRKRYRVSLRHFFVTELGGLNGRIHLHGLVIGAKCRSRFDTRKLDLDVFNSIWQYGHLWVGWCTDKSISYIVKYITKPDPSHPDFRPIILTSPGMGKCYVTNETIAWHHSVPGGIHYLYTSTGHKVALPRYLSQKIFSEEESLERQLQLLDDPPDLVFRGKNFGSPSDFRAFKHYHLYLDAFYSDSLHIGTSLPRPPRKSSVISENLDF